MAQEDSAGVLFRGADGGMYFIATSQLQAFRMADADAAEAVDILGGDESVQGFAAPRQPALRPLFGITVPGFTIEGPVNQDAPTVLAIKGCARYASGNRANRSGGGREAQGRPR